MAVTRASRRWGGRPASTPSCSAICSRSLTVDDPGVAAGGQGRVRLASQGVGHLLGRPALVGQGTTVVDDHDPGGVPGVGGLAGTGLAGVAPVGVQGGATKQVTGFPGAALGAVDRARPGVGQVRENRLCARPARKPSASHLFSPAVDQDGEPSLFDGGHGGGGAVHKRGVRGAAAGVEEHSVPGLVLPFGRPAPVRPKPGR